MPFAFTTLVFSKFVPVTLSVSAPVPATTEVGLMLDTVGARFVLIVNVRLPDVPPPGAGLTTLTVAVPTAVMSEAGTAAVRLVAETYVVASDAPFQLTVEVDTKFVPVTVIVNAGPAAKADDGFRLDAVGAGLIVTEVVCVVSTLPATSTLQ